jgi:hypothetical protein
MAASILFYPTQTLAQPLSQKHVMPIPIRCSLNSLQPAIPVDMNTVILRTTVKTIHVEKEVFTCTVPPAIFKNQKMESILFTSFCYHG